MLLSIAVREKLKIISGAQMNRIEKRAIEALVIAAVIPEISHRLGEKEALKIVRGINQSEAFERGRNMAKEAEEETIEFLVKDVATWGEGGLWEIKLIFQHTSRYGKAGAFGI